jgi:hypothetical protein
MDCKLCGKPIVLSPSAAHRAAKYGGEPEDYTKLFTVHSECAKSQNEAELLELLMRRREQVKANRVVLKSTPTEE